MHWGGQVEGREKIGAFFLKILPGRVARRSQITWLRQERGEGRPIFLDENLESAFFLLLPGVPGLDPERKRGHQALPVCSLVPMSSVCLVWSRGHRWGLLPIGEPLGWGPPGRSRGMAAFATSCGYSCSNEWCRLLGQGLAY